MRKLFAFDIDGTLVDHSDHTVPSSAIESLKELKEQGHIVGIATGRNRLQLQKVVEENFFDFIILCNGAYAEVKGNIIFNHPFEKNEVETIFSIIKDNKYDFMITNEDHLYTHTPITDKIQRVVNHFDLIKPDILSNLVDMNIYQIIICEPVESIESFHKISQRFDFHTFGAFGYDIDQKGITKGDALIEICRYFSVDISNSVAFGDADNDIEFIKNAGTGVAMGNAVSEVKQVANYVTKKVGEHGIKHGLTHLGFIRR